MPTTRIGARLGHGVRSLVLPLAGFLALSAGFLWEPLLTGKVFLPSDLVFRYDHLWRARAAARAPDQVASNPILADVSDYYHPYRVFAMDELREGRVPLWNPYILAGTPFFASAQAALLDPVNVLTAPLDPLASWTWGAWLRLGLLGFFTFGFARALGRSALAATAAGIVFMLSGFVVVWLNYPVVWSLVWMPALFWASTRWIGTGARRHLLGVALATGALLVGGHPETQFLVGLAWAPYALVELSLLPQPRGRLVRARAAGLAAGVVLGGALGAVQWVPFVDFLFDSHAFEARAQPFAAFDPVETGLRLAVLLLPNLAGERYERDYWLPGSVTNNNEQTGYVGLLALALAGRGAPGVPTRGAPRSSARRASSRSGSRSAHPASTGSSCSRCSTSATACAGSSSRASPRRCSRPAASTRCAPRPRPRSSAPAAGSGPSRWRGSACCWCSGRTSRACPRPARSRWCCAARRASCAPARSRPSSTRCA
jgi:hypothetical protein